MFFISQFPAPNSVLDVDVLLLMLPQLKVRML
jgi:hypothetical protein